jgi:hypothetical protein
MSPGKMVDLGATKPASSGKPPVKGGIKLLNKGDVKLAPNGATTGGGIKLLNKGKPHVTPEQAKADSDAAEKAASELKRLNIGAM